MSTGIRHRHAASGEEPKRKIWPRARQWAWCMEVVPACADSMALIGSFESAMSGAAMERGAPLIFRAIRTTWECIGRVTTAPQGPRAAWQIRWHRNWPNGIYKRRARRMSQSWPRRTVSSKSKRTACFGYLQIQVARAASRSPSHFSIGPTTPTRS